jgi:GNAT superfamily N-acetyltransferase
MQLRRDHSLRRAVSPSPLSDIRLIGSTRADGDFAYEVLERTMRSYAVATYGHWVEHPTRSTIAAEAAAGKLEIILLRKTRVGILHVELVPEHVFLKKLFILPEHQRAGIGGHLLQSVLQRARAAQLPVRLRVLRVNPAMSLYEKHGFRVVEQTTQAYFMEHAP